MTLLALWALFVTIPGFIQWAFLDSVWYTDEPQANLIVDVADDELTSTMAIEAAKA